jgi:hypothetical protein
MALYAQAVAHAPEQVYFREAYGRVLEACHQNGGLQNALTQYQAAYALAPSRAINALSIGRILFIHGNINQALVWFETARRTEPHYWECDLWIARCFFQSGEKKKALWALTYLPQRRQRYLAYRQKIAADMPWPDDPSAYSLNILAYDETVVARTLKNYLRRS